MPRPSTRFLLTLATLSVCALTARLPGSPSQTPLYQDPAAPLADRVADLVSRMTLDEKIAQMQHEAPAIPRLGVPDYNWWNECLHGVARAGVATVFPQAIGLAATWDTVLLNRVASVIGDEARAKHHEFVRQGKRGIYQGLTFWSPNINIFRDPRWGRGQETYGEDPYLTSRMGVAFVRGLQGDDPRYLKVVATPKHYAVHSGPEAGRHAFDAVADERDLRETYLPAFEAAVKEGGASSVMCAYNRFEGEPCCSNTRLLTTILRKEWGFTGYVVSDCWAISDIVNGHKIVTTRAEAASLALRAGCDLTCGPEFGALVQATKDGEVREADIDAAVTRLFMARFRLGMFDPPAMVPFAAIPYAVNDSAEHDALALQAARESVVLLKNDQDTLPLDENLGSIAVIGPNADDVEVLLGNYNGTPSRPVTVLAGIRNRVSWGTKVLYARGALLFDRLASVTANPSAAPEPGSKSGDDLATEAMKAAIASDAVVLVMGLSPRLEGEEMKVPADGFKGGDRIDLDLPKSQQRLLESIQVLRKPIVLVLLNGSAVAVNWAAEHVPAILTAWYPGQEGGNAIADVLFGNCSPAGRLPVTFYQSASQLPPFEDYRMQGRTYRFFTGVPLFPFGHGLSYTRFSYGGLRLSSGRIRPGENVTVTVNVKNVGARAGEEVVQLYVKDEVASVPVPIRSLQGFTRVSLAPGEQKTITFMLSARALSLLDKDLHRVVEPGFFTIEVGGKQPGFKGVADSRTTDVVKARLEVIGSM